MRLRRYGRQVRGSVTFDNPRTNKEALTMTTLPLPPGRYEKLHVKVSVTDFEHKRSNVTGKPYIQVTWLIEECAEVPEVKGHKVWDSISLSDIAIWKLRSYEELVWKQIIKGKRIFTGVLHCEMYNQQIHWRFASVPCVPNLGATLSEEPFSL